MAASASRPGDLRDLSVVLVLNALPVIGVVFWGWSALVLLLLYWAENVIQGGAHIAKMTIAAARQKRFASMLFLAPFFTIHYGIFCFGHFVFIVLVSGAASEDPAALEATLRRGLQDHTGAWIALALVALGQAISVARFWGSAEAKHTRPADMMLSPYRRLMVLHGAIILGAALVLSLDQPVMAVAALAVLKTALDVALSAASKPGQASTQALRDGA